MCCLRRRQHDSLKGFQFVLPSSITPTQDDNEGAADRRSANSYDFVRFCAASAVLFSHHFVLSGLPEPAVPGFDEDFGEVAVAVFFCLSGFLICRSLQRSPGWKRFAAARILRIFPTLALVLVASSAVTFWRYRNFPNTEAHVIYVVDNLLMFVKGVTFVIPGVFIDAASRDVNNPIWTLPYELWCYVALALMFVFGARRSAILIVIAMLAVTTAWSLDSEIEDFDIGPLESSEIFRLGSYFLSGAFLAVVWPRIGRYAVAIGFAGLIGSFVVRDVLPMETALQSLALAACVIGLGSSGVMAWFSKGGDASYGMYVFAWPVQQFVVLLVAPFWISLAVAFLITVGIGYAAWHAFEKRLLLIPKRLTRAGSAAGQGRLRPP